MPELPEVEVIKYHLRRELIDLAILNIQFFYLGILKEETPEQFRKEIIGYRVEDIKRQGKYLLFYTDQPGESDGHRVMGKGKNGENNKKVIIIHLRMTGILLVRRVEQTRDQRGPETHSMNPNHLRVCFEFEHGKLMEFYDQRKFATIALVNKGEEFEWKGMANLGPDPLLETFSQQAFQYKIYKSKRTIKNILLDQTVVAGLGNIYTDEVLFQAGVSPNRFGKSLTHEEIRKIYDSIYDVLYRAIKYKGTTFRDYRDAQGNTGGFQNFLQVYKREGNCCKRCGVKIIKTKVAGRGTFFCNNCQK